MVSLVRDRGQPWTANRDLRVLQNSGFGLECFLFIEEQIRLHIQLHDWRNKIMTKMTRSKCFGIFPFHLENSNLYNDNLGNDE